MSRSPEEIKSFLFSPCDSREELLNWIRFFLGFYPLDVRVSRYATSTPADMVWELYQAMMKEPYNPRLSIWIAARGHQKTATVAIFEILALFHGKRNVFHLAAIEKQAARAKEWANKFSTREHLKPYFSGTNNASVIQLNHPETEDPLTYEIAPAQLTRVQGPRSNVMVIDEVSVLKGERIQAYKEAAYIPVNTLDGKPPIVASITSRRGAYTVTEEEIANASKTGTQVKFWTCLEGTKVCPETRRGKDRVDLYVDILKNRVIEQPQYNALPFKEQDAFKKVEMYSNCKSCPIAAICQGDLAAKRKTYKFMRTIEDLIVDFRKSEYDLFLSQMMSLQPSTEGLVFSKYSSAQHKISYRKMWEIYTGEDPNRDITEGELVARFRADGVPCYAGIDWGVTNDPSVAVFAFVTPSEQVFVLRAHYAHLDAQLFLDELWNVFHQFYLPQKYFCDSAQPGNIRMMKRNWGFPVSEDDKKDRTIIEGIFQIRRLLSPSVGPPKFYIADQNCDKLDEEFRKYHHATDTAGKIIDDAFEDDWNHGLDAVRYFLSKVVSKFRGDIGLADIPQTDAVRQAMASGTPMTEKQAINPDITDLLRRANVHFVDNRSDAGQAIPGIQSLAPIPSSPAEVPKKPGSNYDVDF
jgi:hypothetical protein